MSDETPTPQPEQKLKTSKNPPALHGFTGRPLRMLLESEILAAQSVSKTEAEVARRLGVSSVTYKKYADLYGIYGRVKNRAGKGLNKPVRNENGGKYPLDKILEGKFPEYPIARLRIRLIRSGLMEARCCKCGFCEKRLGDGKQPLILTFKDGDRRNKNLANLELHCYNCCFMHINNPHGQPVKFSLNGMESA